MSVEENFKIFKDLNAMYAHHPVSNLAFVIDAVEDFLRQVIEDNISTHIADFIAGADIDKDKDFIVWEKGVLSLVISESLLSNRTLEIAFLSRFPRQNKNDFLDSTVNCESFGRYSTVKTYWPPQVGLKIEELQKSILSIVTIVYGWLRDFVERRLMDVEIGLAHALYSYARATFDVGEYIKRFWFIAIQGQKGYCLFDRRGAMDVIVIATQIARGTELTPSEVSSNFVTNEADFELMVAKDAITLGQCIDVPFDKTKYRQKDFEFSEAESAIHQADSISLFPLLRQGNGFLLAGFPTPSRPIFEPLMAAHSKEITEIFLSRFGTLKKLQTAINKPLAGADVGKLGQFVGGFTKSLLDI